MTISQKENHLIETAATSDPVPSTPGQEDPAGSIRVLIADDDAGTRLLLRKKLEQNGYMVISAKNGSEAINRLSENISAAVIDLKMPGIDGMGCLRHIRKTYPALSPIMLTASENIANAVEAMKHGALDYVTKPFNSRQLIALVEKAVHSFSQTKRLRETERKLEHERQHQLFVASQIQQSLLLGQPPDHIDGLDIAHVAIPSQQIDGDFIDYICQSPRILDILVADVMGKGIMASFMGAALKSAFLQVLNHAIISASRPGELPEPADLVAAVHSRMISQMERFETFVTLCYGRFDMGNSRFTFVDCGHVRTIHYRDNRKCVNLLRGANMPLGFPESRGFMQYHTDFSPGDLFLFYSDGVTEARNREGELFDEHRLVNYVETHAHLSAEQIASGIREKVIEFTQTGIFQDDFTCIAVRVTGEAPPPRLALHTDKLEIASDLRNIKEAREFIVNFCSITPGMAETNRIAEIEIAVVEVISNIIKHACNHKAEMGIQIVAKVFADHLEFEFQDYGDTFDLANIPVPVFDGSRDSGLGCFIIREIVDDFNYFRDETNGRNCTRLKFVIPPCQPAPGLGMTPDRDY